MGVHFIRRLWCLVIAVDFGGGRRCLTIVVKAVRGGAPSNFRVQRGGDGWTMRRTLTDVAKTGRGRSPPSSRATRGSSSRNCRRDATKATSISHSQEDGRPKQRNTRRICALHSAADWLDNWLMIGRIVCVLESWMVVLLVVCSVCVLAPAV